MLLGLVARRRPLGLLGVSATATTAPTAAASSNALRMLLGGRSSSSSHHHYYSSSSRRRPLYATATLSNALNSMNSSSGDLLLRRRRDGQPQHRMPMQLLRGGRRGLTTGPGGDRIVDVVAREAGSQAAGEATASDTVTSAAASSSSPLLDGSLSSQLLALSGTAEGAAAEAAEAAAQAGLGNWPSDWAIRGLEALHEVSGLPYWLTIISVTLVLRTALFPLVVTTARNAAKMTLMRPEMDAITERIKAAPQGDRTVQQRWVCFWGCCCCGWLCRSNGRGFLEEVITIIHHHPLPCLTVIVVAHRQTTQLPEGALRALRQVPVQPLPELPGPPGQHRRLRAHVLRPAQDGRRRRPRCVRELRCVGNGALRCVVLCCVVWAMGTWRCVVWCCVVWAMGALS